VNDDDLKLLKELSVRLAGLLQKPEPGQAMWRQLLADILGDLAGYAPKRAGALRVDSLPPDASASGDHCCDVADRRLAELRGVYTRLEAEDLPRFTEGQLDNTIRFIRMTEEESRFFGGIARSQDGKRIRVICNGDPTEEWKARVSMRAGCIPVTFVHVPPAISAAEPHPTSYSDEDLKLAMDAIREYYRHDFGPGGAISCIGVQAGNRGVELFVRRYAAQYSENSLTAQMGGIPVKVTIAGMLPPRPWSPPGFAEAYAATHEWTAKDKPAQPSKPSSAEKGAAAINKAFCVDAPGGFCSSVMPSSGMVMVFCRREPTEAEREKCFAMAPGVIVSFWAATPPAQKPGEPIPVSPSVDGRSVRMSRAILVLTQLANANFSGLVITMHGIEDNGVLQVVCNSEPGPETQERFRRALGAAGLELPLQFVTTSPAELIPLAPSVDEVLAASENDASIEKGTGPEDARKLLPPSRPKEELKQEAVVAVADEIRSRCTTARPPWYQATIVRDGHVEVLCHADAPVPVRARLRDINREVSVVFTTVGPLKML
jgi:hypothetical protein